MEFSQSTKNIFKALADFRKVMVQPKKEASNPQFRSKYVPLELVTDAIDKVAPDHGLAHFQNVATQDEYMVGVQTVITHESGEHITFDWLWLDARPIVKGGGKGVATTQSQGSAITYGRRYSLSSAFGIASEVDDDGNAASGNSQAHNNQPKPWQQQKNANQSQKQQPPKLLPEERNFDEKSGKKEFLTDTYKQFFHQHMTSQEYGAKLAKNIGVENIYDAHLSAIVSSSKFLKEQYTTQKASGGDWID